MIAAFRLSRTLPITSIVVLCLSGVSLRAQQMPLSPPAPATSAPSPSSGSGALNAGSASAVVSDGDTTLDSDSGQAEPVDSREASGANNVSAPLSTRDILAILKQNPDEIVELKALAADLAQQQGTSLQAESITDEMLYSQIASSPELRANIATFLRARGYLANDSTLEEFSDSTLDANSLSSLLEQDDRQELLYTIAPSSNSRQHRSATSGPDRCCVQARRNARTNLQSSNANEPQVLHRPAPYNMLALRDLYTQLPEQSGEMKRFGSEVFLPNPQSRSSYLANSRSALMDVPAGPDYVVGPGDVLSINLWGGISQTFTRPVDREGRVDLPEAGPIQVAGLTLERIEALIAGSLKRQYRNAQVAVSMARLRTIRVYVVGDVQHPGVYQISSLSTCLNALYAAGGPTGVGSLRVLRHYRGTRLAGEIDLYDFLLHGVQSEDRLESGDTLIVPPAGPQIAVYGAVKRPAIYELKSESTLAEVLDDAGGATVAAELSHIIVERIDAHHQRQTVSVGLSAGSTAEATRAAITAFPVQDGDRVHVSAVLPYSQQVIYMEGHVARPGRTPWHDNMHLAEVLHSYRDLLPEPADRGEIVRLIAPDLHPETIEFNVPDVLIGNSNPVLEPFDTVRVLGRYEADAPKVTIGGEVLRPGNYALSRGMTAAQLVRMAGGFKRDALLTNADLTSYNVVEGTKVVSERIPVHIGAAVNDEDAGSDVPLKAGDVLTVHQLTGWNDIGSSVTLEGEVAHPGRYGFEPGERLSSILRRAGGFRETSYPAGAVLVREDVRRLEETTREQLIRQIETSSASARISPNIGSGDQSAVLQLISQQQSEILARLRSQPASGRMVIHISTDISSWQNTPNDIEVRAGDTLRIPKRPGFVLVSGQVYNASAITYSPGKTAEWYLRRAGGPTEVANKKEIFIIRANGSVVGREPSFWDHNVLSTHLDPGDTLIVPQKIIGASLFWRNLLTVAQISSSIAVTAAVAGVL